MQILKLTAAVALLLNSSSALAIQGSWGEGSSLTEVSGSVNGHWGTSLQIKDDDSDNSDDSDDSSDDCDDDLDLEKNFKKAEEEPQGGLAQV